MATTLESLASKIVVTAGPETSAALAAQLMRQHHVGALVVVDAAASDTGKPVGIVTDRDLVLAVMAEGLDPSVFTVGDVMSTSLVTADAGTGLLEATALLDRHRVRRLVVTDDAGRVVGVAALEDLLEGLVREFGSLVQSLRSGRDREIRERR